MAEDLVVKDVLTDSMVESGAELLRRIDELGWPVVAGLWLFDSDSSHWRLIIASPRVSATGPRDAYKHIQEALRNMPDDIPHVRLQDIFVTDPGHPVIKTISFAIGTGPGIERIRFRENVINGTVIEDALIYRLHLTPRAA